MSVVIYLACFLAPARAAEPTSSVVTLEGLVAEWVELRAEIAHEQRNWKEQERAWREELQLLQEEQAMLHGEIEEARERETSARQDQARLVTRREKLAAVSSKLPALLDRAEAEARGWEQLIPEPLAQPLKEVFRRIPSTYKDSRRMSASRRLQLVVTLFTQIENLQHNIHVTREILPTDSETRKEVDVIYIGLARGFAVARDDKWAAVGSPAPDGWRWEPRPRIAAQARKAVRLFNREAPAAFVELPLQVTGVAQ